MGSIDIPDTCGNEVGAVPADYWDDYISKRYEAVDIDHTDSTYTIPSTVGLVIGDTDGGAITVNLPAGRLLEMIVVQNSGSSGNITLTPDGSETINGLSSAIIGPGESLQNIWSTLQEWRSI